MEKIFYYDPNVSIEGIATALGVLGAAIGYLLNLAKGWRNERKRNHYVGTRLVILTLLERNLWTGLSEDQLWELYISNDSLELRKSYGAWELKKFDRIKFERELRQLQLDFQIDLAGKDQYRLRVQPISNYDLQKVSEIEAMKFVSEHFTREKVTEALKRIHSSGKNEYDRQRALNLLVQLKSPEALQDISNALNASDNSLSIEVASMLTQYLVAYETQESKNK